MKFVGLGFILGVTVKSIKVSGLTTRCTGKVTYNGLMEKNTKENFKKIKDMEMESLDGRMEENMRDSG